MGDELLATVEAVYAAGLDGALWPNALGAITRLVGGVGTTLEVIDRRTSAHLEFYGFGVPPPREIAYLEHYAALNPRIPPALRYKPREITWDYRVLDEKAIDQSPFYAEFLAPMDMRYIVAGILDAMDTEFAAFTVQRSARQGHVDQVEIAMMESLVPHVSQALDMTRRLKGESIVRQSLEHALDWLTDGVALIKADGSIAYANTSFQAIARAGDGLRIRKNVIEFALAAARNRFGAALADVLALHNGDTRAGGADFAVSRPSGAPPYLMSVRPLPASRHERQSKAAAAAIVLIRDPLGQSAAGILVLREIFGLTDAEAGIAQALQNGISLGDYARTRAVSLNTVYTHLRRIKEKTGCHRLAELIGKLNEVRVPLRTS